MVTTMIMTKISIETFREWTKEELEQLEIYLINLTSKEVLNGLKFVYKKKISSRSVGRKNMTEFFARRIKEGDYTLEEGLDEAKRFGLSRTSLYRIKKLVA